MAWLEKLKHIVEIHHVFNFNIVNNVSSKEPLKVSDNKVEINKPALNDKEWEETKLFLRDEIFDKRKATFLEKEAEKRIIDIKEKLNLKTTKDILEFYRDKISPWHLSALEASLYLREAFNQGEAIEKMKWDIIHKFGTEGKNISNLCSSGYFEGYIKELYNEMSSHSLPIQDFQYRFREIIRDSPFAVFVNHYMKKEDIKMQIDLKMQRFQGYGIDFLAIHGIGSENVKKIQEIIYELQHERGDIKMEMKQEASIIQVKITLKEPN